MKRNIARTTLTILFFAVLLAVLMPAAYAATCTTATAAGNWGYTYTGTLFLPSGPVPVAAVGRYTADVNGNIKGTQTRSVAGTATISVYDQSGNLLRTGTLAGVYVNNGKEIRDIFESLVLPDGTNLPVVITAEANKL